MRERPRCAVDGCDREAFAKELCGTHLKRVQREKAVAAPIREYGLKPAERVRAAALRFANAEGDQEYTRAADLLRKYSRRPTSATRGSGPLPEIVQG